MSATLFHRPAPRIALVRHARSAHVHTGWIDAAGFRAWREAYEAAGIQEGEQVPEPLGALAGRAGLVVASDAPRAVATARLLAPGREIAVSPLLRELELRSPAWGRLRLPLLGWAFAVGGRILWESLRRRYPPEAEADRVVTAAGWLEGLAVRHGLVVAVTHASFRRSLAARLREIGWGEETVSELNAALPRIKKIKDKPVLVEVVIPEKNLPRQMYRLGKE